MKKKKRAREVSEHKVKLSTIYAMAYVVNDINRNTFGVV